MTLHAETLNDTAPKLAALVFMGIMAIQSSEQILRHFVSPRVKPLGSAQSVVLSLKHRLGTTAGAGNEPYTSCQPFSPETSKNRRLFLDTASDDGIKTGHLINEDGNKVARVAVKDGPGNPLGIACFFSK